MTRLRCFFFGHAPRKHSPGIDICLRCRAVHRDGIERWVSPPRWLRGSVPQYTRPASPATDLPARGTPMSQRSAPASTGQL